MMIHAFRPALLSRSPAPPAAPPAATPAATFTPAAPKTHIFPRPVRRIAKTVGAALIGAAFVGVPAVIGFYGGAAAVGACTALAGGAGYYAGHHDGKGEKYFAVMFGVAALAASAGGAFGGHIGVGVATTIGALLGLAGDAINRGTRPGYDD